MVTAENTTSNITSDFLLETRKAMGERIRAIWVNSGELQDEFVKPLGVTPVTLSNYMSGKRKPDSEFLFILKQKENICIDWLLTGEGTMHEGLTQEESKAGDIDTRRLVEAITLVEEGLFETKRVMLAGKKAELISAVYDFLADRKELDAKKIKTVIKAAG